MHYDVAVIGAGLAGLATAARLQAAGLSTVVFESHGQPGGCAGFYRRSGFSFDVGATTLVDFEPGGVGAELLEAIGLPPVTGEILPGYVAWLPDRTVVLNRDARVWHAERLRALGSTPAHKRFWQFADHLADVFWRASRRGVKLPIRNLSEAIRAVHCVGIENLPAARFVNWTMGDALRHFGLRDDAPLVGLLSMIVEDTVHSGIDDAPLVNAALGITIRGAGLTRAAGGMRGFLQTFVSHYRALGGVLRVGNPVHRVTGTCGDFRIDTRRGVFAARQVVSAVPADLTSRIAPRDVADHLKPHLQRNAESRGGAIVVFLGVPDDEVASQELTHHQLLQSYSDPLGNGNNMFLSVSAQGDTLSAPEGYRSVMISTHCDLGPWQALSPDQYEAQKQSIGALLLDFARRVYPNLGQRAAVCEVGTPRTYERFTSRPLGSVGGFRQSLANANQRAIPHDVGGRGFWMVGDTTWPGLGTVACVLGSRIVAEGVLKQAHRSKRRTGPSASRVKSLFGLHRDGTAQPLVDVSQT